MSRDDLKDVPLHMMVVKEVKDDNGVLSYTAVLRLSDDECIVIRDDTENKALAKLRRAYYDWFEEPLH